MGHGHQRAPPSQQQLLQPLHRFQVQVVGRLIQQQQIRLGQQQLGQQRTGALAAAEVRQRLVVLVLVEPQAAQHLTDARLVIIAAGHLERGLRLTVGRQQLSVIGRAGCGRLGQPVLHLGQRGALRPQVGEHFQHRLVQRVIARWRWVLGQVAHGQAPFARHIAGRGCLRPGKDAQQRSFARAVRADKPDAIPRFDAQIHAGEDIQRAKRLAQARCYQKRHTAVCSKQDALYYWKPEAGS